MPRPKKSPAEIQDMHGRILDAAYAILLGNGPEALTSRAIAERLGMAHMSLFTYFENQAAILAALRAREMANFRDRQDDIAGHADKEGFSRAVRELLEFYATFARQNPNLYRLAWVMPEVGLETREENRLRMRHTVSILAALIERGTQRGEFAQRDPTLAAATVLGMVNMPHVLFHSGKLADPAMRDLMAEETLAAAMRYLEK